MMELPVHVLVAGVVSGAAPVIFATMGETLTEKAGIINLSLDGTILLSAMTAFATAYQTQSLLLGFVAAGLVGATVASVVAIMALYLDQSQVAVGFVLTLMCRDLAYFLGSPYARIQGPQVPPLPIPYLQHIPLLGPVLFGHDLLVYLSLTLILLTWWFVFRTSLGLGLRAVGEHPEAAFSRGIDPRRVQLASTLAGGFLVGLAGAAYSLAVKPGWGRPQGAEGIGWIALAIVIFGGWHPLKVALGAYLFALLQVIGVALQGTWSNVPAQVIQVAPFPLMIFALVFLHLSEHPSLRRWSRDHPMAEKVLKALQARPPAALGRSFRVE